MYNVLPKFAILWSLAVFSLAQEIQDPTLWWNTWSFSFQIKKKKRLRLQQELCGLNLQVSEEVNENRTGQTRTKQKCEKWTIFRVQNTMTFIWTSSFGFLPTTFFFWWIVEGQVHDWIFLLLWFLSERSENTKIWVWPLHRVLSSS